MNEANHEKVDRFLRSLEEALGGLGGQSAGVLDEVRADLEAHVERSLAEGHSEDEAVQRALDEMGNPFELAHHLRREIPPFGGPVATTLRYVAASGVILWTLLWLWFFRPWGYGFDPVLLGFVVLFHLPVILLLWPRIVWKTNWLFGPGLAFLGVLVVVAIGFLATFLGTSGSASSGELLIAVSEGASEVSVPATVPADSEPSRAVWHFVAAGLGGITIALLMSMQRRTQRRLAVLAVLLGAGSVEAVFQVEELIFRQDRERIRDYMGASLRETGAPPTEEGFDSEGPPMRSGQVRFRTHGEDFFMSWSRPLRPGFSIQYSSADDRVEVQD